MAQDRDRYRGQDFRDDQIRDVDRRIRQELRHECASKVFEDVRSGEPDGALRRLGVSPGNSASPDRAVSTGDGLTIEEHVKLLRIEVSAALRELAVRSHLVNPEVMGHIRRMIVLITVHTGSTTLRLRALLLEKYAEKMNTFWLVVLGSRLRDVVSRLRSIDLCFKS